MSKKLGGTTDIPSFYCQGNKGRFFDWESTGVGELYDKSNTT